MNNITAAGLEMGEADILLRQNTRTPNKIGLSIVEPAEDYIPEVAFINQRNGFQPEAFEDWQLNFIASSIARLEETFNLTVTLTSTIENTDIPVFATSIPNKSALSGVGGSTNFYEGNWLIMTLGVGKPLDSEGNFIGEHDELSKAGWKSIWIHELGHALGLEHPWDVKTPELPWISDTDFDIASADEEHTPTIMGYQNINPTWDEWYRPIDLYALANIWGVRGSDHSIGNYYQRKKLDVVQSEIESGQLVINDDGSGFETEPKLLITANGSGSRDFFLDTWANELIDGSDGVDTFVTNEIASSVVRSTSPSGRVQLTYSGKQSDELDTLTNIERIVFSDVAKAYDIDGSAGQASKTLVAVLGAAGLSNKEYVGIGLELFDAGQSLAGVCELALTAVGATTNEDVVNLLYTNLYGEAPTADVAQPFIDALNNGEYSKGILASAAAELTDDLGVIDLVGLAETGIEYI